MDALEITRELNKINAIHHSLDENNILTYIIFAASFQARLSPEQHEWIDKRIQTLTEKTNTDLTASLDKLDQVVTSTPLLDKIIH